MICFTTQIIVQSLITLLFDLLQLNYGFYMAFILLMENQLLCKKLLIEILTFNQLNLRKLRKNDYKLNESKTYLRDKTICCLNEKLIIYTFYVIIFRSIWLRENTLLSYEVLITDSHRCIKISPFSTKQIDN